MFHRISNNRSNCHRKPRRHKKKITLKQPEWDNTTQDLSIHAATPEEVQRRRIVMKSKNADAARRELKAKKAGIPPSLMVSPAKLQLEMKKLALLRNVLYDQNDFSEVLRRADKTMTSVKGALHEKNSVNAYPHVTVAPGYKMKHPMSVPDQPSRLDALSETMMDGTALNEDAYEDCSDDDYEETKFQSQLNCDHFLSLLKDAIDNNKESKDLPGYKTPDQSTRHRPALNGTEEINRVQSRNNHIAIEKSREIGGMISAIAQDASKVKRKLDISATQIHHHPNQQTLATSNAASVSSSTATVVPPSRANITNCNMTYEDLQDAMQKVSQDMSAFEERRGIVKADPQPNSAAQPGLAGFTKTLIDAITRLIGYVNEGELKYQQLVKSSGQICNKLDHVTALADSLTLELRSEKNSSAAQRKELEGLRSEMARDRREHAKLIAQLREDVNGVRSEMKQIRDSGSNKPPSDDADDFVHVDLKGGGDACANDEEVISLDFQPQPQSSIFIDPLLKNDMLDLLSALKSENRAASAKATSGSPSEASEKAETVDGMTSVEDKLSDLRRQHDQAEMRIKNLVNLTDDISLVGVGTVHKTPPQKLISNVRSQAAEKIKFDTSEPSSSANTSMMEPLKDGLPCEASPLTNPPPYNSPPVVPILNLLTDNNRPPPRQTNFPILPAPDESANSSKSSSSKPSTSSSPLNTIHHQQMSLEERIAELNRQHSEAQNRLQNLRRYNSKASSGRIDARKVQVSVLDPTQLNTPAKM